MYDMENEIRTMHLVCVFKNRYFSAYKALMQRPDPHLNRNAMQKRIVKRRQGLTANWLRNTM